MRLKNLLWASAATLVSTFGIAQPSLPPAGGAGGPATGPPCWTPAGCVPIDSGIVFLLLGGSVLAITFIYRLTKKQKAA